MRERERERCLSMLVEGEAVGRAFVKTYPKPWMALSIAATSKESSRPSFPWASVM
jgi:hypothetical protein